MKEAILYLGIGGAAEVMVGKLREQESDLAERFTVVHTTAADVISTGMPAGLLPSNKPVKKTHYIVRHEGENRKQRRARERRDRKQGGK